MLKIKPYSNNNIGAGNGKIIILKNRILRHILGYCDYVALFKTAAGNVNSWVLKNAQLQA